MRAWLTSRPRRFPNRPCDRESALSYPPLHTSRLTAKVCIGETATVLVPRPNSKTTATFVFLSSLLGACSLLFSASSNPEVSDAAQEPVDATVLDARRPASVCADGTCSVSASLSGGDQDVSQQLDSDIVVLDDLVIGLGDVDSNGNANEFAGFRFENLDIPKDAEIVDARIQFTAAQDDTDSDIVILTFEDSAQAAPFSGSEDVRNRNTISGLNATWNLQSPSGDWQERERGLAQRTPIFFGAMQHLVRRPDWRRGDNAMVVVIKGMLGTRSVLAFETDRAKAATIFVEYIEQ